MTDERWQVAYTIYEAAAHLPEPERQQYVQATAPDAEIVSKVLAMLDEMETATDSDTFVEPEHSTVSAAAPPPDIPLNGVSVGRFVITGFVGQGGMGRVYSAHDPDLNREVALKVIAREADSASTERFIREAQAASALNHPNIVTVHEVIQSGPTVAIAMELVAGTSLRRFCGTAQPFGKLAVWGRQIAQALAAAHARGIVHRDIKPDNLMLRPDGYIKVLDFGIARQVGSNRAEGELPAGTVGYMSPEEVMRRPITAASDIFSLGIVLYELASGTNPFRGDSPGATTRLIQGLEAPPLAQGKGVPRELDRLVRVMLSKSPADRPAASEVALRLEAIAQPRKFRFRTIGVAAVLAICVLGGTAVWRGLTLHRADGELASETAPGAKGIRLRQFTTTLEENRVIAAAISLGGQYLAYAERDGPLVLRDIKSAEVRAITLPKNVIATEIAWFPSGSELLLGTESTVARMPSLWRVSLFDKEPRLLRENARMGVPSPAGNAIAFTSSDQSEVLVTDSEGQQARRLIAGGRDDAFPLLVWSADGRRLSYQRRHYAPRGGQPQIVEFESDYQRSYESISIESGERLSAQPNMRISAACETSGDRVLFLRPDSPTTPFALNVWEAPINGKSGVFKGVPRRLTNLKETYMSSMSCSADGKVAGVLVQVGLSNVYIGDLEQPGPRLGGIRKLTLNEKPQYPHAWTADGQAVIFELGNGLGGWDLYIQRLDERVALPLATGPMAKIMPQLSPDGNWVLYAVYDTADPQGRSHQRLMRVPVSGGTPVEIPVSRGFDEFRCALTPHKRCVLRTIESGQFVYSELDPVRGRGRELARTSWSGSVLGDWALSSDGSKVATPSHDALEARIRVLALDSPPGEPAGHDIEVPGLSQLRGIYWAADDRGWFASLDTATGVDIAYIDRSGRFQVLREGAMMTWGIPSPDGHHLAFVDQTLMSNYWLLDRH